MFWRMRNGEGWCVLGVSGLLPAVGSAGEGFAAGGCCVDLGEVSVVRGEVRAGARLAGRGGGGRVGGRDRDGGRDDVGCGDLV